MSAEQQTSGRHALRWGGRIAAGVLTVAASAALLAAALIVPTPTVTAEAPEAVIDPTPGDTTLACTASFLVSGRDATQAQTLAVAGTVALDAVTAVEHTSTDVAFDGIDDATTSVLTAPAVDGARADIAGSGSLTLDEDDVAGYAATACRPAVTEGWFVGLDTRTGSTGAIVLTNPGTVASVVTLSAFGAAGPLEPATEITVAPGTSRAIAVSALVGTEFSPVIHFATEGAAVQAVVQATSVRGLTPTGIDVSDPVRADALTQVIPGVIDSDAENAATAVRLFAPDAETTAHVEFRTDDGTVAAEQDVDLVAGIPAEVAFDQLDPGSYDVVVTAEEAVVAAAWTTTGESAGADFAWYPAAPSLTGTAPLAAASGATPTLRLVNPGDEDVEVAVVADGTSVTVTVPAGGAAETRLSQGALGSIDAGDNTVYAAIDYASGAALATAAVWPADAASEAVTVTR